MSNGFRLPMGRGYSVLESSPTTQWHYSKESGFARLTERKWRLPAAATLRPEPEKPHANLRAAQHCAFIRQLPCVACGMAAPSEAAHVRSGVDGAAGIKPSGCRVRARLEGAGLEPWVPPDNHGRKTSLWALC